MYAGVLDFRLAFSVRSTKIKFSGCMEEYFVAATYIAVTQLNLSRRTVPENKEYYGVPPASTVAAGDKLDALHG
jgi:hypothetical protein